jgi:transcriptional regulator with XRE-family HTH domain
MKKNDTPFVSFLNETIKRRNIKASQLAAGIGTSHATVSRWLSGNDIPNAASCCKLAEFTGQPVEKVLSAVGHISKVTENKSAEWPEFREYAREKYPNELDEDMITMIEDLIERRREKKYTNKKRKTDK